MILVSIDTPFTVKVHGRKRSHVRMDGWRAMPDAINDYTGKPYSRLERYFKRWWFGPFRIELGGVQKGTRRLLFVNGGISRTWADRPWFRVEVGGLGVTVKRKGDRRS